ncbi:MAG: hypothetical protein V1798_06265 [Pseudomonadota bacterium]
MMTDACARLHAMIRARRLPHGLLLSGPRSGELLGAAFDVASHLLCIEAPDRRPCGRCAACLRVREGTHPDVLILEPEKQELTMEQIRQALGWIARGPFEGSSKVAIFQRAETLNASSSNALLKTLEEPPAHAVLFLLTHTPDALLPTVRSRIAHIRFPSPEETEAPGEELPAWHGDLTALFERGTPPPSRELFELTERIARDRLELPHFFAVFERHLKNRLAFQLNASAPAGVLRHIESIFDRTLRAEGEIVHHYGNAALVLDPLLLDYFSDVH